VLTVCGTHLVVGRTEHLGLRLGLDARGRRRGGQDRQHGQRLEQARALALGVRGELAGVHLRDRFVAPAVGLALLARRGGHELKEGLAAAGDAAGKERGERGKHDVVGVLAEQLAVRHKRVRDGPAGPRRSQCAGVPAGT